jgi:hypothetical protein
MDLKQQIEQRRKEREVESRQEDKKKREVAGGELQERSEVIQSFKNGSIENKQELLISAMDVLTSNSAATSNLNISREHAEFILEAAAQQKNQSLFQILLLGVLLISIYIGFANSWLLAIGLAFGLILLVGVLGQSMQNRTKTSMIEKHRLELAVENHIQTEQSRPPET